MRAHVIGFIKPGMKTLLSLLAVVLVIGGLFFFIRQRVDTDTVATSNNLGELATTTNATGTIEDYIRKNISSLSPEKEVLRGTFYVTTIEAHGSSGTVSYEDGHVAYTADFTYTIDPNGKVTITSFKTRK